MYWMKGLVVFSCSTSSSAAITSQPLVTYAVGEKVLNKHNLSAVIIAKHDNGTYDDIQCKYIIYIFNYLLSL